MKRIIEYKRIVFINMNAKLSWIGLVQMDEPDDLLSSGLVSIFVKFVVLSLEFLEVVSIPVGSLFYYLVLLSHILLSFSQIYYPFYIPNSSPFSIFLSMKAITSSIKLQSGLPFALVVVYLDLQNLGAYQRLNLS